MNTAPYTAPPQKTDYNTIGNALSAHGISWGYFGEGYDNGKPSSGYCGICDPMQYSSSIMTNPALRKNVQHGLGDFLSEAAAGTLPAVSFLKPGDDDGHPGYSTLAAFERLRRARDQRGAEQRERCGGPPRSSSPSTRAAATTTRATSSRSASSATARACR